MMTVLSEDKVKVFVTQFEIHYGSTKKTTINKVDSSLTEVVFKCRIIRQFRDGLTSTRSPNLMDFTTRF